jgi:hypothetical protein
MAKERCQGKTRPGATYHPTPLSSVSPARMRPNPGIEIVIISLRDLMKRASIRKSDPWSLKAKRVDIL